MKRRIAGLSLALALTAAVTTGCVPGDPTGNLEQVTGGAGTITLQGWAIDSSAATSPVEIHIYVDGNWGGSTTANVSRPDVGKAYPGYGADHGFNPTIGAAPGNRKVCAYAINVGSGKNNTNLGCKTVQVRDASPFGNVEVVSADPVGLTLSGWVVDPDNPSPTELVITLNGTFAITTPADLTRSDVAGAYPGSGAIHGFDLDVVTPFGLALPPLFATDSQVCITAKNVGAGSDLSMGCFGPGKRAITSLWPNQLIPTVSASPLTVAVSAGEITVSGTAIDFSDPGDPRAVYFVTVQADDGSIFSTPADVSDPGTNQFAETISGLSGVNRVCIVVGEPTFFRTARCEVVNVPGVV